MILLVGPSACGKTALGKFLEKKGYKKVVTYTTRPKRVGEIDGVDYHFLTGDEFERLIKTDFFYEYTIYQDSYYGTARESLKTMTYLIIEPNGLKKYKEDSTLKINSFYIECPLDVRIERMKKRLDDELSITRRIKSDALIFNDEIKNSCDFVLDGTKSFAHNYEIIRKVEYGL